MSRRSPTGVPQPIGKIEEQLDRHSAEILVTAVAKAKASGVRCSSKILVGTPADAIVKHAEDDGCHGIVMGTGGHGAVTMLVVGSLATKVVHLTALPVTLVK